MLTMVWWLKKNHSPNILDSIIRSKESKAGGDRTVLLSMGESIANRIAFSSWYQWLKEF